MALHLARQQFATSQQSRRTSLPATPRTAVASVQCGPGVQNSWAREYLVLPLQPPRARAVTARVASETAEPVALPAPVEAPEASTEKAPVSSSVQDPKIKVATAGNVKVIAGKIAHSARGGNVPAVVCVGPKCVNTGVKAIAVGRSYLAADQIDLTFRPTRRQVGRTVDGKEALVGVVMEVAKTQPQAASADADVATLNVRGEGQPKLIAGAVAARVREGRPVAVVAIGVAAVYKAVLALALAGLYLRTDKKDLRAAPEFIKITKGDKEISALRLAVLVENL